MKATAFSNQSIHDIDDLPAPPFARSAAGSAFQSQMHAKVPHENPDSRRLRLYRTGTLIGSPPVSTFDEAG